MSIATHAAVVQQRDAVAEVLGLLHEVGDEDHGQALVADALDQLPGLATRLRVEARRQLVEDRQLRAADSASAIDSRWRWPPERLT